jgi:1-acyl-sn-glycerol-3-phosphate acyltransferase
MSTTNKIYFEEEIDYDQPIILMSTHASFCDVVTNLAYFGSGVGFIGKKMLFKIPVFGWCLDEVGCLPVDRSNREKAVATLKKAAEICRT